MKINEVEFDADLEDIIDELQRQLKLNKINLLQETINTTNDIMVQCPYHSDGQENRPSAGIRKSDGMFHCFACNEVHSLPEVISYCFGEDMFGKFGWRWLVKNFKRIEIEERKDLELDFERTRSSNNCNNRDDKIYVTEEELDKYRYYHPYWKKRRIVDDWLIELFDLGYDKATKCITMPNRDLDGNCVFVARRSVNTKYFNYPKGVEKPVYGLYELTKVGVINYHNLYGYSFYPDEIIICESMIDALTCWQYGKYAVALNGLGTERQFDDLRRVPCRKYILATDNDKAGLQARKRLKKALYNKIITEYKLPKGKKDINDLEKGEFLGLCEVF